MKKYIFMAQIRYVTDFCHAFHIEQPKISLIHCSEKSDGKHFPYTEGYLELKNMAADGAFGNCIVDGPLDLKTSCSAEALADKKIKIAYPKSKMNRLQNNGNFGKIFMSVEG